MNLKKLVSIGLCFFIIVSILPISFVHGAALTAYTLTGSGASNGITNTPAGNPSSAISTALRPEINFTMPSAVLATDTISIDLNGMATTASITEAKQGISVNSGTCSDTTEDTFTVATSTNNPTVAFTGIVCTAGASIKIIYSSDGTSTGTSILSSLGTGGNYTISTITASDFGAILYYVGNTNQVLVTASVKPILTFAIRNTADTAEQATVSGLKTCSLGVLSTTTVNTCDYRLKVGSNSDTGYTVSYISDQNMRKDVSNFLTNAASGSNGSAPASAGTEQYGIILTAGTATIGTVTRGTDFITTTTNVYQITKTGGLNTLLTSSGPNAPSGTDTANTSLVQHRATINSATKTGNYNHTVTYTVSATF